MILLLFLLCFTERLELLLTLSLLLSPLLGSPLRRLVKYRILIFFLLLATTLVVPTGSPIWLICPPRAFGPLNLYDLAS